MEFRTRALGEDKEESSSLSKHLDRVFDNIKNDPEIKKRLLNEAAQSDVDPVLLRAFFGDEMPSETELKQEMDTENVETETEVVVQTPEPEQVIGFLEEVIDLAPDDMTLTELRDWAQENPDVVETAIEMRF